MTSEYCQSKEDGVCKLPMGSCVQCKKNSFTEEEVIKFTNWAAYYYVQLPDGNWRRRGGGWNKNAPKGNVLWTIKQLLATWIKQQHHEK